MGKRKWHELDGGLIKKFKPSPRVKPLLNPVQQLTKELGITAKP